MERSLTAHSLNRLPVTVDSRLEGGSRSLLGTSCSVALLVGGAPAQQTRHAPARFALPIGRAWRPIRGTETRGKHRRVHVPFVHSEGGGEKLGTEESGTWQPYVTHPDWVSRERSHRSETARFTRRKGTVMFGLFLRFLKASSLRANGNLVTRDVVTVGGGCTHVRARTPRHTFSAVSTVHSEEVALHTGRC